MNVGGNMRKKGQKFLIAIVVASMVIFLGLSNNQNKKQSEQFELNSGALITGGIMLSFPETRKNVIYKIVIDGDRWTVYNALGEEIINFTNTKFWDLLRKQGGGIKIYNQSKSPQYYWVERFDIDRERARIWVNLSANSTELIIQYGFPEMKDIYNDPHKMFNDC